MLHQVVLPSLPRVGGQGKQKLILKAMGILAAGVACSALVSLILCLLLPCLLLLRSSRIHTYIYGVTVVLFSLSSLAISFPPCVHSLSDSLLRPFGSVTAAYAASLSLLWLWSSAWC